MNRAAYSALGWFLLVALGVTVADPLMAREVNASIATSLQDTEVEERFETVHSKAGRGKVRTPSRSTFKETLDSEYPTTVPTSTERFKGQFDFMRLGVSHFQNKEFSKLRNADKQSVAAFMNEVFEALQQEDLGGSWRSLQKKAIELVAKHQDLDSDGMFQLCHGIVAKKCGDLKNSFNLLKAALDRFHDDDYPTRCAVIAHAQLSDDKWDGETDQDFTKRYRERYLAIRYWLEKDFRATPAEHLYALEYVDNYFDWVSRNADRSLLLKFPNSIETNKALKPRLKSMVAGICQYQLAYSWRGRSYRVSEQNLEKLETHCKIAAGHLEQAHKLNPLLPDAASMLIDVSRLSDSGESPEYWFEKATEHEKGWPEPYNSLSVAKLPRWGGSRKEMFDYSNELAKKSYKADDPIDSDPWIAVNLLDTVLRVRMDLQRNQNEFKEFCLQENRIDAILDALEHVLKSDLDIPYTGLLHSREYWLTHKAMFAVMGDKMKRAADAFQELDAYNREAAIMLGDMGVSSFEADRVYTFALTREFGAEARKLRKLAGETFEQRYENSELILKIAKPLAKEVSREAGGGYFRNLVKLVQLERDYRLGKEIELKFTSDFGLWDLSDRRQVTYISPTEIEIDNRNFDMRFNLDSKAWLFSDTRHDRQIDFDITFPEMRNEQQGLEPTLQNSKELALMLQTHQIKRTRGPIDLFAVGLKRNIQNHVFRDKTELPLGKLVFGESSVGRPMLYFFNTHLPTAKNHVSIRFESYLIEVYLNGEFLFRTWSRAFMGLYPYARFTIPERGPAGRGVVRVSNIRAKQWKVAPLAFEDDKIIKHYQERLKDDPSRHWDEFWLGHIHHRAEDLEKALQHYEKSIEIGMRESYVAFYIGDIYDRQGDWDKASQWYQTSVDNAPAFQQDTLHFLPSFSFGKMTVDSHPEDWARFRLRWHEAMSAGNDLTYRELGTVNRRGLRTPSSLEGLRVVVEQQFDAANGNWERVTALMEKVVKEVPEEYKPFFNKFLASYRKKEIYKATDEELRMHLGFRDEMFFRHFEDRLPARHKSMYRQESQQRR